MICLFQFTFVTDKYNLIVHIFFLHIGSAVSFENVEQKTLFKQTKFYEKIYCNFFAKL